MIKTSNSKTAVVAARVTVHSSRETCIGYLRSLTTRGLFHRRDHVAAARASWLRGLGIPPSRSVCQVDVLTACERRTGCA
jgi:hypothetical protein